MKSTSPAKVTRLSGNNGPESSAEMSMKYKEMISTLNKKEGPNPSQSYYQYQGFWLPSPYLEATVSMQENFKAQSSDIFLCSAPKTGTTWLKALAFSIMTRDVFDDSTNPLLTKLSHQCLPLLESDYVANPTFLDTESLPLLATQLPYSLLPRSIIESDCKIIYICREPKDTFVSMWHYMQRLLEGVNEASKNRNTLEKEFKSFCEGTSAYGPYWDHVLEYWKASVDRPERVFFFKYEDLKCDTLYYVKKLGEFMGKPFSKEEENQGLAEKIVARCHIESLSNLEVNKSGWMSTTIWTRINNNAYFRKGEIGDWGNLLTEDMAKSIDHISKEKFLTVALIFPVSSQYEAA